MTSSFISVGPQSQGPKMDLPILCVKVANATGASSLQMMLPCLEEGSVALFGSKFQTLM